MVDSFERWRELGQRLQLFLQGAILINLESLWPSMTSAITAVASSDLEVAADSAVAVGGRNSPCWLLVGIAGAVPGGRGRGWGAGEVA